MSIPADYERHPPPLLPCAIALSVAVGVFAVVGWLVRGGILPWPGIDRLTIDNGVAALYAALAVIMQFTTGVVTMAARRSRSLMITEFEVPARIAIFCGALWNAYSLHNLFDLRGETDLFGTSIMWAVSGGIAYLEVFLYGFDEFIKGRLQELRAQAEAQTLADANARHGSLRAPDYRAMSDLAIAAGIKEATAVKRNLEFERRRRRDKNIETHG